MESKSKPACRYEQVYLVVLSFILIFLSKFQKTAVWKTKMNLYQLITSTRYFSIWLILSFPDHTVFRLSSYRYVPDHKHTILTIKVLSKISVLSSYHHLSLTDEINFVLLFLNNFSGKHNVILSTWIIKKANKNWKKTRYHEMKPFVFMPLKYSCENWYIDRLMLTCAKLQNSITKGKV